MKGSHTLLSFESGYSAVFFGLLLCVLNGCQISKVGVEPFVPLANQVFWNNAPARSYSVDSSENQMSTLGTQRYFKALRSHKFEFISSDTVHLVLHEFEQEYMAYAAFSERATWQEMQQGFYQEGDRLFFYHGRYLGEWRDIGPKLISGRILETSLHFQDGEIFLKPAEFQFFPLLGRVPKGERVVMEHFLGMNWQGPVFSVQYLCHDDTATLFRGFLQEKSAKTFPFSAWIGKLDTLLSGGEHRFQGESPLHEPVVFWDFPDGLVGIVGCYDPEMALAYVEKMKKMAILWKSPRFFGKNERMN